MLKCHKSLDRDLVSEWFQNGYILAETLWGVMDTYVQFSPVIVSVPFSSSSVFPCTEHKPKVKSRILHRSAI